MIVAYECHHDQLWVYNQDVLPAPHLLSQTNKNAQQPCRNKAAYNSD